MLSLHLWWLTRRLQERCLGVFGFGASKLAGCGFRRCLKGWHQADPQLDFWRRSEPIYTLAGNCWRFLKFMFLARSFYIMYVCMYVYIYIYVAMYIYIYTLIIYTYTHIVTRCHNHTSRSTWWHDNQNKTCSINITRITQWWWRWRWWWYTYSFGPLPVISTYNPIYGIYNPIYSQL